MHTRPIYREVDEQASRLSLLALLAILALSGVLLLRLAGLPHLPAHAPSLLDIEVTLRGSDIPLGALAYLFTSAAWLVWLWIAGTLVLQVALLAADRWSDSAPGVAAMRQALNRVTLPVVRHAAEAVFGVMLLVSVATPSTPIAAAAPAAPIAAVTKQAESPVTAAQSEPAHELQYIVQPDDNLWTISQRFYGTGLEYPRLVDANAGRRMADGQVFGRDGVIQSGWVLRVPLPSTAIEEVDGHLVYVVEAGDTLSGIAARLLGDETKWPEIFQLNAGKAGPHPGDVLNDPNLIWPGLQLQLPAPPAPAIASPPPQVVPSPTQPAPPSPSVQPAVPTPAASSTTASTAPQVVVQAPAPAARASAPPGRPGPRLPLYAAGAAAALAATAVVARRSFRRSLNQLPAPDEADVVVTDGFAEADTGRAFRRRMAGADIEPMQILAEHAQVFLEGHGLRDARIVSARHGRSSAALSIACGFIDQRQVLDLAAEFGRRLGAQAQSMVNADQDVIWQLSGLKLLALRRPTALPATGPLLIPVGVLPSKHILYGNWPELGHVLIAGLAGGGADVVLTAFLSALVARRPPEDLQLHTLGTDRGLPPAVLRFPHQAGAAINPADEAALLSFADRLDAELSQRIAETDDDSAHTAPEMLIVIEELAAVAPIWQRLDTVATHGPACGIRLLAGSGAPHLLNAEAVRQFGTSLVLQTLDADQSMLLAGQPDAADLRPGELLLRLDGRRPVRARGFRLAPDYLDEFAAMMTDAYADDARRGPANVDEHETGGVEVPEARASTDGLEAVEDITERPDASPTADEPPAVAERTGEEPATTPPAIIGSAPGAGREAVMQTMLPMGPGGSVSAVSDGTAPASDEEPLPDTRATRQAPSRPMADLLNGRPDRPLQVECFGALRVLYGDRDLTAEDGAAHHKAWELLAFVASRPNGATSREKLFDALWPDMDVDHAENALRQIRFRLRNHLAEHVPDLGGELLRSERDGTCRLNPELAGSDAQRFWALCRAIPRMAGDDLLAGYDELSAIYRSDLLIDPCFEWVHQREDGGLSLQERCREEFRRITKHVARLCHDAGQPERAVPLYRRLLLAEPTLEDVARDLYRCYEQLGDRSALIREHRHLRQAIQQMFADPDDPEDSEIYDPDPETVAVYDQALSAIERSGARRAESA